ncbi:MAG: metallophosphoesterase [Sandaracinaceae bacterium]|nr:metallophosphoesterase [Sandaracinaceae bacterium]
MPDRTVIVGDIHGCLEELRALLGDLRFESGRDRLVSVGDLVGKGPDGAGVVRFMREGGHEAVLGNHDEKLLRWRAGETKKPLSDTHAAHAAAMTDADWAWLEALPLYLEIPELDVLVVHAGVVPGVPIRKQRREDLLLMRSLRPDGTASPRLGDGRLWGSRYQGPPRVVFGHDAITGLQRWPHAIGLDTGCCYGGHLSALVLPENRVAQRRAFATHAAAAQGPLRLCPKAELSSTEPRPIVWGRLENGRPREVLVLATPAGEPRAYVNVCMHLPVPLDGGSRQFMNLAKTHLMCGTHGALYRLEDGYCTEGPCEGSTLEALPIWIDDDGWVVLD